MPLFEVALIEKPTANETAEGKLERLILPPMAVIAIDDKTAAVHAIMLHKDKVTDDPSKLEVLVRPFVTGSPR